MPAIGPATACAISITLIPASGPVIAFLQSFHPSFGVGTDPRQVPEPRRYLITSQKIPMIDT
jgi:hypothetical protein